MRRFRNCLSVFLTAIVLGFSVIPALAVDNMQSAIDPSNKISEELNNAIANTADGEYIPVSIWYRDVSQSEIDNLTRKKTGLTPEKCDLLTSYAVDILYSANGSKDEYEGMRAYVNATAELRAQERVLTDTYIHARRTIANDMYAEESEHIITAGEIDDDHIIFNSAFAPMIIAELTSDEIEMLSQNPDIISISYCGGSDGFTEEFDMLSAPEESTTQDISENTIEAYESIELDKVYEWLGLSGEGVKIGLVEGGIPGIKTDIESNYAKYGFDNNNILNITYDPVTGFNNIDSIVDAAVENYDGDLKIINIVENGNADLASPNAHKSRSHVNSSAGILVGDHFGIAKGAKVYATVRGQGDLTDAQYLGYEYSNVEALVKCEVNILIGNIAITDNGLSADGVTNHIRYNDHMVACHNITVVLPGGNEYKSGNYGKWISPTSLSYNSITVGGYYVTGNEYMRSPFKWQSRNDLFSACQKPDVLGPADFEVWGTSVATPTITAILALMMELKPALAVQPQAVKAILLASCHQKANPDITDSTEPTENIFNGITDRQGAGIPSAWTMAKIICHGTYGVDRVFNTRYLMIEQPPYEATNMNVSIAWLREMPVEDDLTAQPIISDGTAYNLSLKVDQNGTFIMGSNWDNSSTEMCYFPLSQEDYRYRLQIDKLGYVEYVRFGYAWSTDNMYETPSTMDGIYMIRNGESESNRYINKKTNTVNSNQQISAATITNTSQMQITSKWILKATDTADSTYTLCTGYGTEPAYLGISNVQSGTKYYPDLTSTPYEITLYPHDDGTYSIISNDGTKVLSNTSSSGIFWISFNDIRTVEDRARWRFNKIPYQLGDINADGHINQSDVLDLQMYIAKMNISYPENNIQLYLADVDKDDQITIVDAALIRRLYFDNTDLEEEE